MRILTVFTGGTISCSRTGGVLAPDGNSASLLLQLYHQQYGAAAFDAVAPYTVLSENLGADNLRALRDCITENAAGYDGVIVTHGTDTLPYAAAYLDYVLGEGIPVVLVSANYPLTDTRSNGLCNFAAAVEVIRSGERGVFVAYHNTGDAFTAVHRGRDVLMQLPYDDSLYSLFRTPSGFVRDGRMLRSPAYRERERESLSDRELNGQVLFLRPYVGMRYPAIDKGVKSVLLEGWHSGTLATAREELRRFCAEAAEKGVPVYLTGSVEGFEYESKKAFEELRIQVLPPLSPVAAYMRLWLE